MLDDDAVQHLLIKCCFMRCGEPNLKFTVLTCAQLLLRKKYMYLGYPYKMSLLVT